MKLPRNPTATEQLLAVTNFEGDGKGEIGPDMFTHLIKLAVGANGSDKDRLKEIAIARETERFDDLIAKFIKPYEDGGVHGNALIERFSVLVEEGQTIVGNARKRINSVFPEENVLVDDWNTVFVPRLIRRVKAKAEEVLNKTDEEARAERAKTTAVWRDAQALYISQLIFEAVGQKDDYYNQLVSRQKALNQQISDEQK